MTKRSPGGFERKGRDFYPTPIEGVFPLLPFLPRGASFIEPCAGNGSLIRHLARFGHECTYASDIEPEGENIEKADVLFFGHALPAASLIITNPPWKRDLLHPMIEKFRNHAPTWLLLDADWAYTDQAIPHMKYCQIMKVIGRMSWEGNGVSGKDNCCWYLFGHRPSQTVFIPKEK